MEPPAKIPRFRNTSPEETLRSLLPTANDLSSKSRHLITRSENAQKVENTVIKSENLTVARDVNTTLISVAMKVPAKKKTVTSFRIRCPAPVPNFVGRDNLLRKIHLLFESCATKTEWLERTVIIHGLGGMGKSELARKYVQLHIDDKDSIIQNVAWIDSETKTSLEKSFRNIARKFGLKTKELDAEEIAESVYEHFSEHCEAGLFIFDNAEQLRDQEPGTKNPKNFGISKYLPTFQHEKLPLILITSRNSDWEQPKGQNNAIGIPELDQDQAVELLITKLDLDKDQKEDKSIEAAVRKLNEFIQGLPLALILAASYIRNRTSGNVAVEVEKYIRRFEDPKSGWRKDQHSGGLAGNYTLVMDTVWEATFEKIKSMGDEGKCALTLLNIMAYLPTDNLGKSLVDDILAFGYSSLKQHSGFGYTSLKKFSLISLNNGNEEICIHRLVQRCTRERLEDAGKYSVLVNIGWYYRQKSSWEEYNMRVIHRDLKELNWPENSFRISIHFLSIHWTSLDESSFALELARDLYKAIEDDSHAYVDSLAQGYSTLLGMLLYIVSETSVDPDWNEDEATATLRRKWNHTYKGTFEKSVKIYTSSLTSIDFLLSLDLCSEVQQEISDAMALLLINRLSYQGCCIKARDSLVKALNEVTLTFTSEHFSAISKIYETLNVYDSNELNTNSALALIASLQLHFKCYINDISVQTEQYWINGPILYEDLNSELKKSQLGRTSPDSATPWEKSIVDALLTHSGLQVVQQHLCFDEDYFGLGIRNDFIEFILRLITVYNCSEAFKETPSFLHSLRKKTTGFLGGNLWLLVWLALFPPNHEFEDKEGAKWSLNCVVEEMNKFVEDWSGFEKIFEFNVVGLDEDALISCVLSHVEFDGHSLKFKNALAGMVTLCSENSTGAAGKLTHVLDDVWRATFEKIKSEGAPGECALTLLNVMAFLPNEYKLILKSQVNKILEFVYSQHEYCINEGLSCLQSFLLIIMGDVERDEELSVDKEEEMADVKIFVPQHLQRFCRQRLDSGDHSDLLSIWRYLCQYQIDPDNDFHMDLLHAICGHLKERNWPNNAIQPSIILLSRHWNYDEDDKTFDLFLELATHLSKVLDDDEHSHSPLLEDGYRTLLGLSLYFFSENHLDKLQRKEYNKLFIVWEWNTKYKNAFDESIEIFTNFLMPQYSNRCSTICSQVQERIVDVFERSMEKMHSFITIRIKIRDSVLEALNRTTITAQHSHKISTIYKALNAYDPDELNLKAAVGLNAALQFHFQFSLNCNSRLLENQDYWTNGPIRYRHLHCALRKSKEKRTTLSALSEWEKTIVNAFIAHEGPKVVQQNLSCGDDSEITIIQFVTFLVTEYNWAETFKEIPFFLHSLKEKTSRAADYLKADYLLLWLALFPPEEMEGRKWSLSIAEAMKTFLAYHYKDSTIPWIVFFIDGKVNFDLDNDTVISALRPHLNLSESSGQEDLIFKTAVALMDGDIRKRIDIDKSTEGWETLFRDNFDTPDRTRLEILEVGKTHGFI